jgi:hypothetical protein
MRPRQRLLIGLAILIFGGWLTLVAFRDYHPWRGSLTHAGPLNRELDRYVSPADLVARLPPLHHLAGNGFRFAAMPYRGDLWFAVAAWQPKRANTAKGVVLMVEHYGEDVTKIGPLVLFDIPLNVFRENMQKLDGITGWWRGEAIHCLHGTPVAFERVRHTEVTSGEGNALCSDHFRSISAVAFELAKPTHDLPDPPSDGTWMPRHVVRRGVTVPLH